MFESDLHANVCNYLRLMWPGVVFWSDGSGNNLSPVQAARNTALRSSRGIPDLLILAKRGPYGACALELKTEKNTPYLKSGKLSTDAHVQEQAEVLQALMNVGYFATFGVGFDDCVAKIEWYFSNEKPPTWGG
jgi:hypothetical protein